MINGKGMFWPDAMSGPTEAQKKQIARRYGAFLHFGINTFNDLEWSDGTLPVSSYAPDQIDADSWVRTVYEAGMNFVILITKHHDGFCMWDTKSTDYSVRMSPNRTDVVAEVAKACRKYGISFGLYYSLWDRNAVSYREDFAQGYISYMLRQLEELLDGRYGDVCELWFDGPWDKLCPEWRYDLIYDLVKRYQPDCQIGINHTIGNPGYGDPEEQFKPFNQHEGDPIRNFPCDFRLWDPHPTRDGADTDPKHFTWEEERYYLPFEMTVCSKAGFSWFNSSVYQDKEQMDPAYIAACYRKMASQDNIMVVNLPPDVHGRLSACDVENILKVADMLGIRRKV